MQATQIHNGFFLVFERGDELISTLARFCETTDFHWAQFSGIGAVERIELGYYDMATRQYVCKKEEGPFEVVNLDGNVAELDEKPWVQAHGALARCDETLAVIGGHIRSASVALTLEMCLWQITQPLMRRFDDETGLNLISI